MAELDAVLPALRASGEAPFAMMVRGTTYRERAEAAPALLDSLGQAYVEGKRYGNTKEFPIATLRGVEVSASPMLSSDEMIVKLSVPGRTRSIQAKDFTGQETTPLGLVRRVENMVGDTENYRGELGRRHDYATTRMAELKLLRTNPRAQRRVERQTATAGDAHRATPDQYGQPRGEGPGRRTSGSDGRAGPATGVESGPEPDACVVGGVRRRGTRPPRRSPHRDAATAADRVDSAPDHEAPEVPRAVRLAYMGMANPNTTPICHARDVMPQRSRRSGQDRDHTRDQDRTGNAAAVPAAWIGDRVPPLRLRDLNGRYGVESPLCTAYPCRYRGVLRPQVARYV